MRVPFKQIGLTTAAAGVAAAAIVGAWGAWTTGDAADQATRSGVLDLDLGAASFSTAFGTETDPIVPGDSGCRVIVLTNDGNVDMDNLRLHIDATLTEGNYVDSVTGGEGGDVDETVTSDEDDFRDNLSIQIDYEDAGAIATSAIAVPATCDDVDADGSALATTTLTDIDSDGESDELSLGDGAGVWVSNSPDLDDDADVVYLAVNYSFDSAAPETAQNVYGNLEWIFKADQRPADSTM